LRRHAVEGTFDVEDVPLWNEDAKLRPLNASDFGLVGADREDWDGPAFPKIGNVIGIAVDDSPSDACSDCRFRDLRHPSADGLDENSRGPLRRVLNNFDELLGLVDGIVVGVDDLNLDAESRGHFSDSDCLFRLVIVLSCSESNNYIQFFHGVLVRLPRCRILSQTANA